MATSEQLRDLTEKQVAWLEGELKKSQARRHVFVLSHFPVDERVRNTIGQGREQVERLLKQYRPTAYLCGHRHFYAYHDLNASLHLVCNDLCWSGDNGYVIYHIFPDHVLACYKAVGEGRYWRVRFPNPRGREWLSQPQMNADERR